MKWAEEKPILGAILFNMIFGLAYLPLKIVMLNFGGNPVPVLVARYGLSLLGLLALRFAGKIEIQPLKKILPVVAPICLLQFAYSFLEGAGSAIYPTGKASVIGAVAPLFSTLLAIFVFHDHPNWKQWGAMGVGFSGVILVNLSDQDGQSTLTGFVLLFLAMMSMSVMNIFLRKVKTQVSPWDVSFCVTVSLFCCYFLWGLVEFAGSESPEAYLAPYVLPSTWICVAYLALCSTLYGNALRSLVFAKLPTATASSFAGVCTVTAVLAGVVFLEEKLGFTQIFGVFLVISGILGVNHFGHAKVQAKAG